MRSDERAAQVHVRPGNLRGENAAADPVVGLQHRDRAPGGVQDAGRNQSREAGTDDGDVHLGCSAGWGSGGLGHQHILPSVPVGLQWLDLPMGWETHPVTPDRFGDFADVINPNRRETHCWCLSHRLPAREIEQLGAGSRERAARALCAGSRPPGVATYRDGTPVGWCSLGPRSEIPKLERSKLIRPIDDVPAWAVICVVVRSGHRRQGVTTRLLEGAVAWAASEGAPAVDAHPVDPGNRRMDLTMAFVGTRQMFEQVGFEVVGTTDAVASSMPRLVMRRTL